MFQLCVTPTGLAKHQASGAHRTTVKMTTSDRVKRMYSSHVKDAISEVEHNMEQQEETTAAGPSYVLPCGWALKKKPTHRQNSKEVIAYIQAIFDIGKKTKEKANATTVSQDMRTATDDDGNLLFSEKDWLQPNQVKNLFSSMAKKAKTSGQKRLVSETDFGQKSTDADEPEDNPEENEMLQNIIENTTAMTHPVIFQNINLCEKRSKLGKYGEKKVKSMVEALELSPTDTNKWSLVDCLKEYLLQCPCCKKK